MNESSVIWWRAKQLCVRAHYKDSCPKELVCLYICVCLSLAFCFSLLVSALLFFISRHVFSLSPFVYLFVSLTAALYLSFCISFCICVYVSLSSYVPTCLTLSLYLIFYLSFSLYFFCIWLHRVSILFLSMPLSPFTSACVELFVSCSLLFFFPFFCFIYFTSSVLLF